MTGGVKAEMCSIISIDTVILYKHLESFSIRDRPKRKSMSYGIIFR